MNVGEDLAAPTDDFQMKTRIDLWIVQVFACHTNINTTEKYKQTSVEELNKQVEKSHPF